MERERSIEVESRNDFKMMIVMKEKRRVSRSKGKRTYSKDKLSNPKNKTKRTKNIAYDQNVDYDDYELYQ